MSDLLFLVTRSEHVLRGQPLNGGRAANRFRAPAQKHAELAHGCELLCGSDGLIAILLSCAAAAPLFRLPGAAARTFALTGAGSGSLRSTIAGIALTTCLALLF